MSLPDRIAAIRAEYEHCFGCGQANPIGLGLNDFRHSANTVSALFTPRPDYHGFSDLLHGGIVATALDEIMAWSAILVELVVPMTAKLELRYRKPATVATTYALEGEVIERRGRKLRLQGRMINGSTTVADASGLFLAVEDLDVSP